ncbi:MAG: hypothetical protein JW809_19935 [Pirellulales bacterium]|nr:hypothetical protein [Pirellulales bacterium]
MDQMQDVAELVRQLRDPQTRRAARQELVASGAVSVLLACLDDPNESVVWAAVESLGELRCQESVEPLVKLLERGMLIYDVAEALARVTGRDLGTDPRPWRDVLAKGPAQPALDVAACVAKTAEYLGARPTGSGDSFRFELAVPDGRRQKVAVYFGRKDAEGHDLVVIYSECGPADSRYYEAVLRKNLSIPAGAFAIRDIDGVPHFVMVDTMVAGSVTPGALARKIEHIAARADSIEKSLTREDKR